ncbi:heme peroxidase [Physocladia obscura]|uniref:Peroxidase n=1 Tax=Physocladia obscura TaxID=109957 RepID=A0AAD5SR41_9FUNG|nr:heme peroxidase [Physocladia obscura]
MRQSLLVLILVTLFGYNKANAGCPYARREVTGTHGQQRQLHQVRRAAANASFNPYYSPSASAEDWDSMRSRVLNLINLGNGPRLIRIAWDNAKTWDAADGSGGSHAQTYIGITTTTDINIRADYALLTAIRGSVNVSLSDTAAFAGAVSASNSCLSGVTCANVTFRPGRADATTASDAPISSSFSEFFDAGSAKPADLRASFSRLSQNLTDREIVALMGAHNLGDCHLPISGYAGPWTLTPLAFENTFFRLLQNNATYVTQNVTYNDSVKTQYIDTEGRMMLFVDMALTHDDSLLNWVNYYASNENSFFADFGPAFSNILELGLDPTKLSDYVSTTSTVSTPPVVAQSSTLPAGAICYPADSTPIYCVLTVSDGNNNTVYTVHSVKAGWAALGVGSNSMANGDVIIGWKNSTGGVWTNTFTTIQHAISVNPQSPWQQIPLTDKAPSWANISFSAVHLNTIDSNSGLIGNDINGAITFAVSSYAPISGNIDKLFGVTSFFQHDISGILVKSNSSSPVTSNSTSTVGIAVGATIGGVGLVAIIFAIFFRKQISQYWAGRKQKNLVAAAVGESIGENQAIYGTFNPIGRLSTFNDSTNAAAPVLPVTNQYSHYQLFEISTASANGRAVVSHSTQQQQQTSSMTPSSSGRDALLSTISSPSGRNALLSTIPSSSARDADLLTPNTAGNNNHPRFSTAVMSATTIVATPTADIKQNPLFEVVEQHSLLPNRSEKINQEYVNDIVEFQQYFAAVQALMGEENLLDESNAAQWNIAEVAAWVIKNGGESNAERISRLIKNERITGAVLMVTRISDLCSLLGIHAYGDRVLFEAGITKLRNRAGVIESVTGQTHVSEEPPLYLA